MRAIIVGKWRVQNGKFCFVSIRFVQKRKIAIYTEINSLKNVKLKLHRCINETLTTWRVIDVR